MSVTSFAQAIDVVRKHAFGQFDAASAEIARLTALVPPSDPELKRKHAADLLKAQNEQAAALKQLGDLEDMLSEHRGRAGYDAVVKLMEQTQAAAVDVYKQLLQLTADPAAANHVATLANLLLALARVSPASIWQKDSGPPGTAE